MFERRTSLSRPKFGTFLRSDPNNEDEYASHRHSATYEYPNRNSATYDTSHRNSAATNDYRDSTASTASPIGGEDALCSMSPWNQSSPFAQSPWLRTSPVTPLYDHISNSGLIGSFVREEGHIYSLAASGDLLFTGSDSKNIRVWKKQREFSGFKASSGLVKAIVISGERIFTGHQDGKIRVWKASSKKPTVFKHIGSLPKFKDYVKKSMKPSNYVEVRRHKNAVWIKHFDAISCLSLNEDQGLLYSGSWDKTLKVWRIADSKCLESINAHDDAVNSVVSGFDGLVFTGSADGTVKVWRRELQGKRTKHFFLQTLLKQESAVTALAVNQSGTIVYSGGSDGVVNFWEREMHLSHGGEMRGHKQAVLCLAAAGDLVFSGSADKSICVWRRETSGVHNCMTILNGHNGPVKCLAVEKEQEESGRTNEAGDWILYSGSLDKSVKVWKISEAARAPDFNKMASLREHEFTMEDLSPTDSSSSMNNYW